MLKSINLIGGALLLISLILLFVPLFRIVGGILLLITFVVFQIPMYHKAYRTIKGDYEQEKKAMKE